MIGQDRRGRLVGSGADPDILRYLLTFRLYWGKQIFCAYYMNRWWKKCFTFGVNTVHFPCFVSVQVL